VQLKRMLVLSGKLRGEGELCPLPFPPFTPAYHTRRPIIFDYNVIATMTS